ncbi:glycoside hydrolase family 2 TIM barrel-domain containing protein [Flavicella sediminum]|uniref:glycoside hydrolase family 2 TIM barrel-domain containing protein n=1 Tax=Flavicella sediminum TaxID=2585141 RepID=UPI0011200B22|nr:glycoside hydrolase family 2 TIM barrel-domain containing protein [Flavicella sediminum]
MTNIKLVLFLFSFSTFAQHINFDESWKFIQQDISGAEQVSFQDAAWKSLNLPHDWSIEGAYDESNPMGDKAGYLPAGFGWYRKTISVPAEWKNKQVEIAFEGVFMNSTVWANGQKLGNRPYGWISFAYDISEIVDASESITFAVRVDNDKQPAARWYTGSGIYSHTWIDVKNKINIKRDGIFVRTEGNTISISTELSNTSGKKKTTTLKHTIIDANGNKVASLSDKVKLGNEAEATVENKLGINAANLWSVESPYLYTLVSQLEVKGKIQDVVKTKFGVRDVKWVPESGIWINGKNVKLQGVCNHQDAGALGAAVPDKIIRFRVQQLKDMGVNAIRTSHNPQTPIFYDICDELGMLVMDEIFDGWMEKAPEDYGARFFKEWWKKDLTDWIKRDRNHPSIIIYSLGNETKGEIGAELVKTSHLLDPTRPVTSGHSGSEYMDVLGVNGHSEKKGYFDHIEEEQEGKVFIGTENTHTWQVRGFYRTKTWFRDGYPSKKQKPYALPDLTEKEVFTHDWIDDLNRTNHKQIFNSSYDNAMVRVSSRLNIAQLRDIPQYAGSFRWTGYDYIGEAGYVHGGWPFKAFMGGAIDLANFEKDLFYLYQSQWTSKPMVHILPHWTHPKVALGTEIPVWVYSNADEVELFFDGKSLGKQKPGKEWLKMQCQWMVKWKPGTIKAVAYKNGKVVAEENIATAGVPSKIKLTVDGEKLASKANDLVQVRVSATDEKGEFYPYGENRTYFHVIGSGKIKALDNGSPVDVEQHVGPNHRKAFYGLTRAYIEATDAEGSINLLASCILGEKKQLTSNKVSIDTKILNLRGAKARPNVQVFYTIDGSKPSKKSTVYTGSFEVTLGTTVKALVVLNGKSILHLEERFAKNEGFTWNENSGKQIIAGEQAEDATIVKGNFVKKASGVRGKGYVKLNKEVGAFVEWYQENDGGAGEADLFIRYSGKINDAPGTYVKVIVNGKVVNGKLFLRNTRNTGNFWNKVKLPIRLERGANTVKIETVEAMGICIDEILIN